MIESRVADLTPAQRALLSSQLIARRSDEFATGGGERLVAHVVFSSGKCATPTELREHLGAALPAHMIPDVFNFLPELPMTPNGKVDRRSLAASELSHMDSGAAYVEPNDDLERMLCSVWSDVLEVSRVGATEDFFELGGHSLHAIRAVSKIRDLLQVSLSVPAFLAARTVRNLAVDMSDNEEDRGRLLDTASVYMEVADLSAGEIDAMILEQQGREE